MIDTFTVTGERQLTSLFFQDMLEGHEKNMPHIDVKTGIATVQVGEAIVTIHGGQITIQGMDIKTLSAHARNVGGMLKKTGEDLAPEQGAGYQIVPSL